MHARCSISMSLAPIVQGGDYSHTLEPGAAAAAAGRCGWLPTLTGASA